MLQFTRFFNGRRASGCLLGELEQLGSLIVKCAFSAAIPSGGALAVDRELLQAV
jgi:folate-dependent tRNA-U54 methylase TrmFO/GidA